MLLIESIEHINNVLISLYGRVETKFARYRVVWSDDQFEKRWVEYTLEGMKLIHPRVEERKKYGYIEGRYVLEAFMMVPFNIKSELVEPFSYEPIWVFWDEKGEYLPPRISACQVVIDTLHRQSAKTVGVKYKDPEDDPKIAKEVKLERIKKIEQELFGDESDIADALHYNEGIVVPREYDNGSRIRTDGSEKGNDKSNTKSDG